MLTEYKVFDKKFNLGILSVALSLDSLHCSPISCLPRTQRGSGVGVMDEHEFQRLLHLFPVVRTRDYCQADAESSAQSSSRATGNEVKEWQDAWGEQETRNQDDFWDKLKSAAEKKVGPTEARRFCDAFQKIYLKLVHEELSREAIQSFLNSS